MLGVETSLKSRIALELSPAEATTSWTVAKSNSLTLPSAKKLLTVSKVLALTIGLVVTMLISPSLKLKRRLVLLRVVLPSLIAPRVPLREGSPMVNTSPPWLRVIVPLPVPPTLEILATTPSLSTKVSVARKCSPATISTLPPTPLSPPWALM